jgi:hypothetical protein
MGAVIDSLYFWTAVIVVAGASAVADVGVTLYLLLT